MQTDKAGSLRIDRWLWFTRFYKTRSLASAAVTGGHVRINGERGKPGSLVVPGDLVELVRNQLTYRLTVTAISVRRGTAPEARLCYSEDKTDVMARETMVAELRRDRMAMPRTAGKPDKHTRRQLRSRNRGGGSDSS
jgi:ribosome-associated heat shock protein Hsp15